MSRLAVLTIVLAVAAAAHAQPAPPTAKPAAADKAAKLRAKAFVAEALRQSRAGDKIAAIGLLEAAYREFPDSRILVNIALTQRALGRLLEAAATCERFLADPNRAANQVAKVTNELAAIDAKLARLEIVVVAPTGAAIEVQVDDGPWQSSPSQPVRVLPGAHQVRARGGAGTVPVEVTIDAAAGALVPVRLDLTPPPPPPPVIEAPPAVIEAPPAVIETPPAVVEAPPTAEVPEAPGAQAPVVPRAGRLGATLAAAIDPQSGGGAGKVTLDYAATSRLTVHLGGMLGGNEALHAAATVAITTGRLRPVVTVGGTMAFYRWSGEMVGLIGSSSRTLLGLHGAVGAEYWLTARLGAVAAAALEYYPSGEPDIHPLVIIPTVGVRGRL